MARTKITRNYEDAREYVRGLGIKDTASWHEWAKSDARPKDIPANPWLAYRAEFEAKGEKFSINDFIGAQVKRGRPLKNPDAPAKPKAAKPKAEKAEVIEVQSEVLETVVNEAPEKSAYETAKDIVRGLRLKSRAEFTEMSKNGKRPEGVPARPDLAFEEWEGWGEFLGNTKVGELVNA